MGALVALAPAMALTACVRVCVRVSILLFFVFCFPPLDFLSTRFRCGDSMLRPVVLVRGPTSFCVSVQGMEKQRVENRDGSEEAIMAKTNPFAIVRRCPQWIVCRAGYSMPCCLRVCVSASAAIMRAGVCRCACRYVCRCVQVCVQVRASGFLCGGVCRR